MIRILRDTAINFLDEFDVKDVRTGMPVSPDYADDFAVVGHEE